MSPIKRTATDPNAPISNENALRENMALFQNHCLPTVSDVHSKLTDFSNSFNSFYRVSLLNCDRSERQSLIYTMITLKDNIECALAELGKSLKNQTHQFSCGLCDEKIIINPNEDMWSSLQNHEHFEELYYQFLNNQHISKPQIQSRSNVNSGNSNSNSNIELPETEPSTSSLLKTVNTSISNKIISKPDLTIAYLRVLESKNCDICFFLNFETTDGQLVTKEIRCVVKTTDTLVDLKINIIEKIIELGENDKENHEKVPLKLPCLPEEIEVEVLKQEKPYRDDIRIEDFCKLTEEKFLKVFDNKFSIIINAPLVRVLELPRMIVANFPTEPSVFKWHHLSKAATKFLWYKSVDKNEWEKVGEGYEYDVKESDVGHFLKLCCVPFSNFKVKGPIVESISDHKVDLIGEFPTCPFEKRHEFTKTKLKGKKLRIVSYNVLADRYVNAGDKFPYCPLTAQGIHYRKQLIIRELEGYNADLICLQEVDDPHYKTYYKQELNRLGFRSFFNRKGNCIPEGLVCAFRRNRFRLVDFKHIVLKTALGNSRFREIVRILDLNQEVRNEFIQQKTSLQSVVLEDHKTKHIFVVGNTHLYYRPEADHIRLLQAFMATLHLGYIKNRMIREFETNNVAVIFCGDFNSDVVKSLYGFMIKGTIDRKHEDCLKISPFGDATLHHKFHILSACGTPKFTNYTDGYKGCLDYIFIEKQKFSVVQVVPLPKDEELEQYEGLPNEVYPSDHLSLVVDVRFNS